MAWCEEQTECTCESAFALASAERHDTAWLDSSLGDEELGQRSMVALELEPGAELHSGQLVLSRANAAQERYPADQQIWSSLDRYLGMLQKVDRSCPIGLIGYISYEAAHFVDSAFARRTLPVPLLRLDNVLAAVVEDGSGRRLVARGATQAEAQRRLSFWRTKLSHSQESLPERPLEELRKIGDADPETAKSSVAAIVDAIAAGRVFQACYTYPIRFERPASLAPYFANMRRRSPADYGAYLRLGDVELASSSPERFLHFEGREVFARPMKGTRRRVPGREEELAHELSRSEKDRAENVMIVDLMRNDLGRVAKPGSVRVPALFTVERYATVLQMTSTIQAELQDDVGVFEAFAAAFPPGSMTGAPKVEACRVIDEQESEGRGLYAGSVAWIGLDGRAAFSVVIRSLQAWQMEARYNVGGGIVADSTPEAEWQESRTKAALVLPHES